MGTAYLTFILLVLQYLIGEPSDTTLDGSTNPVDELFSMPPQRRKKLAKFVGPLKDVSDATSY
jgi:hypothetical protein